MPVMIVTTVIAADKLNPNSMGENTPVQVKIFYMTSDAEFQNHDFFTLFEKGKDVIGQNLLDMKEAFIAPGKTMKVMATVDPTVEFVGIIAGFRDVTKGTWKSVTMVPSNKPSFLVAYLEGMELIVMPDKSVKEGWFY